MPARRHGLTYFARIVFLLALLLFVALAALPVVVLVLVRNAKRAAAGFPAWSTYRVRDPNAVESGRVDWSGDNDGGGTWGDLFGGGSSDGGDVHGGVDAGGASGDAGGGHGD
jgi:hypothetical protein